MKTLVKLFEWLFVPRTSSRVTRPGDDHDDGVGVLVPAGPKPRKGGAHAKPPPPCE